MPSLICIFQFSFALLAEMLQLGLALFKASLIGASLLGALILGRALWKRPVVRICVEDVPLNNDHIRTATMTYLIVGEYSIAFVAVVGRY